MHLDDERIQRWIDGELPATLEGEVRDHLQACTECQARVSEAREEQAELHDLLRQLDHPGPRVSPDDLIASNRPRSGAGLRPAAGVLLALGLAGAAYAFPGSPLPGWLDDLGRSLSGGPEQLSRAVPTQAQQVGTAGIAMPSGTRLVVSFDSAQRRGEAVVTIVDGAGEVTVRAPAGAVSYDAGPDRLAIGNGNSSASYSIEIPADAPWVEIRVAERRVLLKEGPRVTLARGPTTTAGPYRLPLQP